MDLKLRNKVAVITGPAKGMGAAVTLAFADEGCALVLAGRDTAAIEPVAQAARAKGVPAIVVRCDLTDPDQTDALARAALSWAPQWRSASAPLKTTEAVMATEPSRTNTGDSPR